MTRVLAVASEIFPLIKTGGLADVTGALPLALGAHDVRTVTLVPGYPAVMRAIADATEVRAFPDLFDGPARVLQVQAANLDLLVLDAPHLYARAGNPYLGPDRAEWPDNGIRFAGLGAAAAAMAVDPAHGFDILHAHDWQAAMAVVYLHVHQGPRPATVLTVHNLAFQGRYPAALFPRLGLPDPLFHLDGMEFHGDLNFLKGGLLFADRLTTVSPTYAREITAPENGMGLDGVLRLREDDLVGILNGIDDTVWDPATDPLVPYTFDRRHLDRRLRNKTALQERMGLDPDPETLLLGVISRMTTQKGLDLLIPRIAPIAAEGMQLIVLGGGDPAFQRAFTTAAAAWPRSVGCMIGYDEPLAHLIQAGTDALLVPSRFEPCGLTQLYALRYGSVPVVSRVGGLADSVIDANEAALAAEVATGLQFAPVTEDALWETLLRLHRLWHDRKGWKRMQRNGMAADVSWRRAAGRYADLYASLLPART
ncbi:MAG TPA: glycogen synthase GlgA [Rhodopila sp.]|uniref:glycogen synthase GlgA n=1 Tax=Rhodopila sp. TaxID=2480087 RepID=UPI002C18D974|nr:glycogen synthase GlgA [Rhodopila sp.]HVY13581.1 glycogen synthase GlgA [Rhodopila sp.]